MITSRNKLQYLVLPLLICGLAAALYAVLAQSNVDLPPGKPGSFEEKVYKQLARAENLLAAERQSQQRKPGEEPSDEATAIADSLVAMGPSVVPPVLNYLENELLPDIVTTFQGGSSIKTQHSEGRLFCTLILGRLGQPAANSVVETLKRRLLRKRALELNEEYVSVLAMIGESSIKPIIDLVESSDATTSNVGLTILMAVLNVSDQDDVGTMPSPSSFMGFSGDWIERFNKSGTTLSATLPESIIQKLIDPSGKPMPISLQDSKVNAKWATLPVFTALGMIDHPSRQVVDALKEGLKHRPHSEAYDLGYDIWRRAAMSVGRVSLREGKVLSDADCDEIADELVQAVEGSGGYGTTEAGIDALSMLAVRQPKYVKQVSKSVSSGMISPMSLMTVVGATKLMDTKNALPIVEALLDSATRANHNDMLGEPGGLTLALANLDSRFITRAVPILIEGWHYVNNEAGVTPIALMKSGIAGKAAVARLKELAAKNDQYEYFYNAYRCLGCSASAVLYRQTFSDCADSFVAHPYRCYIMADPENPMYYASPDGVSPYHVSSRDLMVSFVNPDDLQFEALLEATPYVKEFQQFRPVDKIASSVAKKTEEFRRSKALTYASKLYAKALQLYAKSNGDQRALMGDAVRDYALVLDVRGKQPEATAMKDDFKQTGTLAKVPK